MAVLFFQVVKAGLSVDEALKATDHCCSKQHLYQRVKVEQDRIVLSAKEGAMAVLASVAVGDTDTATSSLTPSPMNQKRKKVTPSVDSSALLKTIDEGGTLHSQSEKTNKLVEAAVQDGVKFFFSSPSLSSKLSKKSSTSSSQSDQAPKRTSAQASYHRSFMLKHKLNVNA